MNNKIPIGGFHKQSLIDYHGHIAAVIFTCGCNFNCRYCHNAQLIDSDIALRGNSMDQQTVLDWINNNKLLLDGVVITGGEPTLHSSLPDFLRLIKQTGLKIKLDTNGSNPEMLEKLINENLTDYIAMDVKAPLSVMKYREIVGDSFDNGILKKVKQSIKILQQKRIECEFRTTIDESLTIEDFKAIAGDISGKYYIQNRITQEGRQTLKMSSISSDDIDSISHEQVELMLRE